MENTKKIVERAIDVDVILGEDRPIEDLYPIRGFIGKGAAEEYIAKGRKVMVSPHCLNFLVSEAIRCCFLSSISKENYETLKLYSSACKKNLTISLAKIFKNGVPYCYKEEVSNTPWTYLDVNRFLGHEDIEKLYDAIEKYIIENAIEYVSSFNTSDPEIKSILSVMDSHKPGGNGFKYKDFYYWTELDLGLIMKTDVDYKLNQPLAWLMGEEFKYVREEPVDANRRC